MISVNVSTILSLCSSSGSGVEVEGSLKEDHSIRMKLLVILNVLYCSLKAMVVVRVFRGLRKSFIHNAMKTQHVSFSLQAPQARAEEFNLALSSTISMEDVGSIKSTIDLARKSASSLEESAELPGNYQYFAMLLEDLISNPEVIKTASLEEIRGVLDVMVLIRFSVKEHYLSLGSSSEVKAPLISASDSLLSILSLAAKRLEVIMEADGGSQVEEISRALYALGRVDFFEVVDGKEVFLRLLNAYFERLASSEGGPLSADSLSDFTFVLNETLIGVGKKDPLDGLAGELLVEVEKCFKSLSYLTFSGFNQNSLTQLALFLAHFQKFGANEGSREVLSMTKVLKEHLFSGEEEWKIENIGKILRPLEDLEIGKASQKREFFRKIKEKKCEMTVEDFANLLLSEGGKEMLNEEFSNFFQKLILASKKKEIFGEGEKKILPLSLSGREMKKIAKCFFVLSKKTRKFSLFWAPLSEEKDIFYDKFVQHNFEKLPVYWKYRLFLEIFNLDFKKIDEIDFFQILENSSQLLKKDFFSESQRNSVGGAFLGISYFLSLNPKIENLIVNKEGAHRNLFFEFIATLSTLINEFPPQVVEKIFASYSSTFLINPHLLELASSEDLKNLLTVEKAFLESSFVEKKRENVNFLRAKREIKETLGRVLGEEGVLGEEVQLRGVHMDFVVK